MPGLLQTVNRLINGNSSSDSPNLENVYFYYSEIVSQARNPVFYERLGVPDTLEGRFDCISLHMALALIVLKFKSGETNRFSQDLFDLFFADVDRNLREIGVGDLSVGRQVKKLASNFYGVLAAYEGCLQNPTLFASALERNLFGAQKADPLTYILLGAYMQDSVKRLTQVFSTRTKTPIEWPELR
ncbi:Ubiquinol-cytochrome C chaperone family protein [Candidatus Bealeia paramacronuclearis]|uniref:Ubiquinol-cytochrome C chaperone family protein n=2 Tax=Candidatus Bealeia paramacronuclearis TaxID=1921001 RepID=A0ABZ2C2E3_9PROT|nr:Ubiquinol-cytochrome C chaperone family protein [Candidatus Bealeia paramacronuclearis]